LGISLLSVLIGASVSSSFRGVSASPEGEACATTLLQNPEMMDTNPFVVLPDAVICLAQSESNSGECVSDLAQAKVLPEVQTLYMLDTLVNSITCLARGESDTTLSGACIGELVRLNANPKSTLGELIDAASDAVICLARI
jgi:hypothetical protein